MRLIQPMHMFAAVGQLFNATFVQFNGPQNSWEIVGRTPNKKFSVFLLICRCKKASNPVYLTFREKILVLVAESPPAIEYRS